MKKKFQVVLGVTCALALSCCMLAGCSSSSASGSASASAAASASVSADQKAADEVAALIDKIYVQERTATTDADCAAAKAAWDKLTSAQQEMVEGENADPDYFGRDTGDASKDDPRNADNIGDKEILVVSFGTSFNDSRVADIKGIEDAIQAANPDWSVRRAFTAQIIINHIQARDNEAIDNMDQALERAVKNGVKELVVQPTHLMHGAEYDEMCEALKAVEGKMTVKIAEPMLGPVGETATTTNADKKTAAQAIVDATVAASSYASVQAAADAKTAFVFMGHGTSHAAAVTYSQMQATMAEMNIPNIFVGTVEGEPEATACEEVIKACKEAGYENIILRPLMVVAGDHANNDMAGEDDPESWLSMFKADGSFKSIEAQIDGMGSIPAIQAIYVAHTAAVM